MYQWVLNAKQVGSWIEHHWKLIYACIHRWWYPLLCSRPPPKQKREIQMAIRKNRETNAVLTRLNSELQQQLKVPSYDHLYLQFTQRIHILSSFSHPPLRSMGERKSYGFGMTSGCAHDDRFYFWANYPFNFSALHMVIPRSQDINK